MTKVLTKALAADINTTDAPWTESAETSDTVTLTEALRTYLQEQVDFIADRAVSQLGIIANWANIASFQTPASYDQMFGNDYGLAMDSNQKLLKYCAQSVAGDPESLVQVRATGSVYGTQDASGAQSTVASDTDQNKIQVNEMAFEAITNASERYNKAVADIVLLNKSFGMEPTTSREERYELWITKERDMKRRKQENQARSEAKFAANAQRDDVVVQLHKVAQTTAHLI